MHRSILSPLRIIVTGLIAQHPRLGGMTWHYLHYVLGLSRLGHDVFYFEDSGEFPYNLDGGATGTDWIARDCKHNVGYLAQIMSRFGLEDKWAYHFPLKSEWFGLSDRQRQAVVQSADLLINVSGSLEHPNNYRDIPHLLYIDTDPVITQIKMASNNNEFHALADAHDTHFSFGETMAQDVPASGYRWRPTRQPIALSEWQSSTPRRDAFTTIMNWTSYEPLVYADRIYGQKNIEFKRFLELPEKVAPAALEVALSRTQYLKRLDEEDELSSDFAESGNRGTDWTPYELITNAGWRVVDAIEVCGDLDRYRHYVESSKAEWSVAKNAYVEAQPGWFSERSACYLAAGRPVIIQETGFSSVLPVGEGLLSFRTLTEAAAGIQEVEAHYARHAEAARAIAEAYFDSDKVLTDLIDAALNQDDEFSGKTRETETHAVTTASAGQVISGSSIEPGAGKIPILKQKAIKILQTDPLAHPAVLAWTDLFPGPVEMEKIAVLKQKKNGAVYRLVGIGPENSSVIVKRSRHEKAVIERLVYEEVLPNLPVLTAQYYGCVEEADGRFWWLFLEDLGDAHYSPFTEGHPALAAQWLADMQTAAESLTDNIPLPERGADHYLKYLQSARAAIPKIPGIAALQQTYQTILRNILSLCDLLEADWVQVEYFCERMPRTFIHGDCLVKNVLVHTTPDGRTLAPVDWGGAGWGLPATDLGQLGLPYRQLPVSDPDCSTYLSQVQDHWPDFDIHIVQQLANLGRMFWSLKVISRGMSDFDYRGAHIESIMNNFDVYRSVLSQAIRSARWEN